MAGLRNLKQALDYKKNTSARKERKARLRDMYKVQEDLMKRQAFKAMLVDMIQQLLPSTSEEYILIKVDKECEGLLDTTLDDSEIVEMFDIERDPENPCNVLFSWAMIDIE